MRQGHGGAVKEFGQPAQARDGGGGDSAQVVSAVNSLRKALVSTGVRVSNMPDDF